MNLKQLLSPTSCVLKKSKMKYPILLLAANLLALPLCAQQPLYIVNGTPTEQIASIPPEEIEHVESLPADEQSIARYGAGAAHGVLLITLRYDQAARFQADSSFNNYIARQVTWGEGEPTARVVLRYTISPEGKTQVKQELESTDSRLKRRVLKALGEAPDWLPACKNGQPIESEGVLYVQLPAGKQMPQPVELVIR